MANSRRWLVLGDFAKEARINHVRGTEVISVAVTELLNSGRIISVKLGQRRRSWRNESFRRLSVP